MLRRSGAKAPGQSGQDARGAPPSSDEGLERRKWERYQAVEEILQRHGVVAALLSPEPRRRPPPVVEGWEWTSFNTRGGLLLDLIRAGRIIREEGFSPEDSYARRSREETRRRHELSEGFSIHEMYGLLAHALVVAMTSGPGGADSPLQTWLTTLEWGSSTYDAPAELEWAVVDHALACRGPLEKAGLVKRLTWEALLTPDDQRRLREVTTNSLLSLSARYLDAARTLRRREARDKASELELYAAILEEAAKHFWE